MMCLLLGGLAIASVRKNKRLSASLFDQRKQGQQGGASQPSSNGVRLGKKRSSSYTTEDDMEGIEFTPMTNQQREMVPLVEDELEII